MTSLNPEINALHASYCASMGIDPDDLPLGAVTERQWYAALKEGVTPDIVKLAIHHRRKRIAAGVRHPESLRLRNMAGSEEAIAEVIEDAAAERSRNRIEIIPKAKAEVLRVTGRLAIPRDKDAVPIGEVIKKMRENLR